MTHRIAVIGGDGVGPEVVAAAIPALEAAVAAGGRATLELDVATTQGAAEAVAAFVRAC